jgi:phosphoglycerate kinase
MKLRTLPASVSLRGKRVFLRVDWNVPLCSRVLPEDSLKIERSLATIRGLAKRGAVVIVLTHLGRPEKRNPAFSTERLLPLLAATYKLSAAYHSARLSVAAERAALKQALAEAEPGTIHVLENVRFEAGEEKNAASLAKAYAELGDLFVNDAFASCHRAHVSVAGLAKALPSYAGPQLVEEVQALHGLLQKPKRPFVAFLGGFKLSTKIPVLKMLLGVCDRVYVGGAMAVTLAAAKGWDTGASFVEKNSLALAKTLVKKPNLLLPTHVAVADAIEDGERVRYVSLADLGKKDIVVDIAPLSLRVWAKDIKTAKTLLWNGPLGVAEIPAFAFGSRFLARAIATRAKGSAFGVAGGGDTLPVLTSTRTVGWFDHVSMGGGAMLEFLALKGKLPGLLPLLKK